MFSTLEVFRLASSPLNFLNGSSSHRLSLPFRDAPPAPPRRAFTVVRVVLGDSHGVSRPSSAPSSPSRRFVSAPPDTPALFDLSQVLEGFFLDAPCGLVSCHSRSWGFRPPELFPPRQLYPARHQAIPSRRFTPVSEDPLVSPPGLYVGGESVPGRGVFHPLTRPMLSWAFTRFCGPLCSCLAAFLRRGFRS